MPKSYIFGFKTVDLHELSLLLTPILEVEWKSHDSISTGGYYRSGGFGSETFQLLFNYSQFADGWHHSRFKSFPVIIYVNHTERGSTIIEQLQILEEYSLVLIETYDF